MSTAQPGRARDTLQDALANSIASLYYDRLLRQIRERLTDQLRGRDIGLLREQAVRQWTRTAARTDQSEVQRQIEDAIIPRIRNSAELVDCTFLLFFFVDALTGRKRFWSPTDKSLLQRLGWPYDSPVAIDGTAAVVGLKDWDVPLTSSSRKGLKGSLEHQYISDLTDDQFATPARIYNPDGDWLVGIKSAVYLGIPPDSASQDERLGQLCVCSPIPFLFGTTDLKETSAMASDFFEPYIAIVNSTEAEGARPVISSPIDNLLTRSDGSISFAEYFHFLATYRQASANEVARNWIYQTIGLTHKHRIEAEQIGLTGPKLIERFFDAAERHPALGEILDLVMQERPGVAPLKLSDFRREVTLIRQTEHSRHQFYEFLNRFGHRALGRRDGGDARNSPKRPKTAGEFKTSIQSLLEQLRVIHAKSLLEPVFDLEDEAFRYFDSLDWGAFEFIWHQLLSNAADKGDRLRAVRITVGLNSTGEFLLLSAKNFLRSHSSRLNDGSSSCVHDADNYVDFRGDPLCRVCFSDQGRRFFDGGECWDPATNGGRFGLFMIRHFIRDFYGGSVRADTAFEPEGIAVTFTVSVPTRREG